MKSEQNVKNQAIDSRLDGLSTAHTADLLGVSQRTIQRWMKKGNTLLHEKFPRLSSRKLTSQQENGVLKFLENNSGFSGAE